MEKNEWNFWLSSIYISREIITDKTDKQIRAALNFKVLRIDRNQTEPISQREMHSKGKVYKSYTVNIIILVLRALKAYNLQREIYFSVSVEINDVVTGLGQRVTLDSFNETKKLIYIFLLSLVFESR